MCECNKLKTWRMKTNVSWLVLLHIKDDRQIINIKLVKEIYRCSNETKYVK